MKMTSLVRIVLIPLMMAFIIIGSFGVKGGDAADTWDEVTFYCCDMNHDDSDGCFHCPDNFVPIPVIYSWQPKKDITAYELALALTAIFGDWDVESLPPEVQRHFE